MKLGRALAPVLLLCVGALAAEGIPAGTTLPVTLGRTLDVGNLKAGDRVTVKLSQSVPLGKSERLRSGTKISGRVIEVQAPPGKNQGSSLTLRFDRILTKTPVAVVTALRAIASPLDVNDAKLPATGPDRGTAATSYTTVQIGEDVVYRGGGSVEHNGQVVGQPVYDGVLVHLAANPERHCPAEVDDAVEWHATSVFGSAACGAYGLGDLEIEHAGRTEPQGQIVLRSKRHAIRLYAGTALLLRVTEPEISSQDIPAH